MSLNPKKIKSARSKSSGSPEFDISSIELSDEIRDTLVYLKKRFNTPYGQGIAILSTIFLALKSPHLTMDLDGCTLDPCLRFLLIEDNLDEAPVLGFFDSLMREATRIIPSDAIQQKALRLQVRWDKLEASIGPVDPELICDAREFYDTVIAQRYVKYKGVFYGLNFSSLLIIPDACYPLDFMDCEPLSASKFIRLGRSKLHCILSAARSVHANSFLRRSVTRAPFFLPQNRRSHMQSFSSMGDGVGLLLINRIREELSSCRSGPLTLKFSHCDFNGVMGEQLSALRAKMGAFYALSYSTTYFSFARWHHLTLGSGEFVGESSLHAAEKFTKWLIDQHTLCFA